MWAIDRIQYGLKVMCYLGTLLSLVIIMRDGSQVLNTYEERSKGSIYEGMSKIKLVLLVTFLIFSAIYGVVCAQLTHSSMGDLEDMVATHLIIIIESEVSIPLLSYSSWPCAWEGSTFKFPNFFATSQIYKCMNIVLSCSFARILH